MKEESFNERLYFGVVLPLDNLVKSPFFGFAWGTDRPSTLIFNLMVSLGLFGIGALTLIFSYTFSRYSYQYLLICFVLGITVPDLNYIFTWLYLGVIYSIEKSIIKGKNVY